MSGGRPATFRFQGREYAYLEHWYNWASGNERSVEVPIAQGLVDAWPRARVLEVGNVLGHYANRWWECVDRYEVAPGVINEDILTFRSKAPYDLIVSVGTVEHVRFDEPVRERGATVRVITRLQGMLAAGGLLWVSVPLGYNLDVEEALASSDLLATGVSFMVRISRWNEWRQCERRVAMRSYYDHPFPGGNAIAVIEKRGGE